MYTLFINSGDACDWKVHHLIRPRRVIHYFIFMYNHFLFIDAIELTKQLWLINCCYIFVFKVLVTTEAKLR